MKLFARLIACTLTCILVVVPVAAQTNRAVRSQSSQSVNRNTNTNVNRNTNVNKNTNVNVNRDVNVNVNNNYRGGVYYGGGCCYHPVATAAAVTAATVATAAVVGSIVNTLPPSCTVTVVGAVSYQHCGSTWYQPQFSGGNTTYVVVNAPR